jgi:gas vesicle protein
MKTIKPEFDACRESIKQAQLSFERLVESGRKNLWSNFFTKLCEEADDIVAEYFGDNDRISSAIERSYKRKQEELGLQFEDNLTKNLNTMQESIETAMKRLLEDVQRVEFQQCLISEGYSEGEFFRSAAVDMGFEMKDFGKMAFSIGSYVATGAAIGSTFPGIGTAIGAAVGAAIGVLISLLSVFTSKEKRIRKAQAKIQDSIEDVRCKVMIKLKDDIRSVVKPVRESVEVKALAQVNDLYNNMAKPIEIVQQQISLMKNMRNKLEKMPYGTIQAI